MDDDHTWLDRAAVGAWLEERGIAKAPITARLMVGGHSNLTFEVQDAWGRRLVVRRPPLGDIAATAHDMGREHRIISGLRDTPVPVAGALAMCEDVSVTGAPFFVMKFVDGIVLADHVVAESFPMASRAVAGDSTADVLAAIHGVDVDSVGLGDLSRQTGYLERQLRRWNAAWETASTDHDPLVREIYDELVASVPPQLDVSLVHGDFRLENCIVGVDGRIRAVLDWELCTLGDPLADVGLLAIYWTDPEDKEPIFPRSPTVASGFARRAAILDRYAEASGRDLSGLTYYVAFSYWKLACISVGVLARYERGGFGNRSAFEGLDTQAGRCARAAAQLLGR